MSSATIIVRALLEADDVDPKEFAERFKPQKLYRNIIFLQGDDADEAFGIVEEHGSEAAFDYLCGWDYGEGDVTEDKPWGEYDDVDYVRRGTETYAVSWSHSHRYVGLCEVINDFAEKGEHE